MENLGVKFNSIIDFRFDKNRWMQDVMNRLADVYLDREDNLGDIVSGKIDGSTYLGKIDRKQRFVSVFHPSTGFYVRSGIYDVCSIQFGCGKRCGR